jgi:hypothetical protein
MRWSDAFGWRIGAFTIELFQDNPWQAMSCSAK